MSTSKNNKQQQQQQQQQLKQKKHNKLQNLSELGVADSKFLGFVIKLNNNNNKENDVITQIKEQQNILKEIYPNAAHIPYAWFSSSSSLSKNNEVIKEKEKINEGYNEDNEPSNSVGPYILHALKEHDNNNNDDDSNVTKAIYIVRIFGGTLLGVTCGRLSQCYKHISKLSLHRYYNDDVPIKIQYIDTNNTNNLYGLASGDTELLLNIIPTNNDDDDDSDDDNDNDSVSIFNKIKNELKFNGFKGSYNEALPRLQNLQADIIHDNNDTNTSIMPIYRYPGNYNGNEWITYPFSKTSLHIKNIVQAKLDESSSSSSSSTSAYNKTIINHCVTNYYRNNNDYIQHHNDKTLDLNTNGVIVSLSLGTSERIFELKRKIKPYDIYQILLPIGSMLILGPNTNKQFTHSILKQQSNLQNNTTTNNNERISLTFRQVTTYLDESYSGRIYGQGSGFSLRTLNDVRNSYKYENRIISFASTILSTVITFCFIGNRNKKQDLERICNSNDNFSKSDSATTTTKEIVLFATFTITLSVATTYVLRYMRNVMYKQLEERMARKFFTSASVTGSKY